MKMPKLLRRKKLRASTARRSLADASGMDYEEMSEPNMKLSRALLIVLVLHVVAVAGIIAFNAIKTRQGGLPPPPLAKTASVKTEDASTQNASVETQKQEVTANRAEEKPKHSAVAKEEPKTEKAKHTSKSSVADSGKTYVVAKGDNPVTIARKFKVSYDSLIELNHIDDPKKLKIGQKLSIPAKTMKATKKSDD
jgi:nucleoid-associated protein YgaU